MLRRMFVEGIFNASVALVNADPVALEIVCVAIGARSGNVLFYVYFNYLLLTPDYV